MGGWRCVRGLTAHVNTGIYACLIAGAPVHMRAQTRTRVPFALRGRSSCCAGMVMSGMVFSVDVEAGASAQMHRQAGERVRKLADTSIPPLTATAVKAVATCALRLARALDLPRLPHGSNAGIDRPCMRCRAGGGAQSSVYAFPHASGKHAQDGVSKQRTGHGTQTRRGTRTSLTVSSGPFPVVSRVTTSCSPDRPRSAWPLSLPSRRLNGVADGSLRVRSSARPRIKPVDWMEHVKRCRSAPRA